MPLYRSAVAIMFLAIFCSLTIAQGAFGAPREKEPTYPDPIDLTMPHISTDTSIKYDFDIVYVRAPRHGDNERSYWAEIAHPTTMDYGADLVLLHPNGTEEVLVKAEEGCSATDPAISF